MSELHLPHSGNPPGGATDNVEVRHEESDVNIAAIFSFGGGLMVVAATVLLVVYVLFGFFERRAHLGAPAEYPLAVQQGDRLPPEPRLQTNPREDLSELRAKEDELLESYGWVDKNAGVVRIPIEVAMKLALERGLPARQEQRR